MKDTFGSWKQLADEKTNKNPDAAPKKAWKLSWREGKG
jgi:hypothetical protein